MIRIKKYIMLVKTLIALGIFNLWRVFYYRLSVKFGLNPVRQLWATIPQGQFFRAIELPQTDLPESSNNWWGRAHYFGAFPVAVGISPPDWHVNPINGKRVKQPERPWWQIPDFDPEVGDIKCVWEASRFDWVITFAQRAIKGDGEALARLECWLADWCQHNPPYLGSNWKCGQEASIRVMHLAMAARLLQQHRKPESTLLDLIDLHLQRIAPTISYAVAQDNNHGTSEAAALFIGGSWLHSVRPNSRGEKWAQAGRFWLENRVKRLIESDGSFSQYSLNYHRVMLDTLCMVEVWRREFDLLDFSKSYLTKAQAASNWLYVMTRADSGDAPNLGANDGARLLPLTNTDYRDFRPSVQLATVLFKGQLAYRAEGSWNGALRWLGLELPSQHVSASESVCLDQGGYMCLSQHNAFALLRYPRFHFRPSQADALHLDFWLSEMNVLRDAGSFSYNTEDRWLSYFPGTQSHNTVQFDDRDQMPRLSRFLFGNWLKTQNTTHSFTLAQQKSSVCYSDGWGARHTRQVSLTPQQLVVKDSLSGFQKKAVLRWRLMPGDWTLQGNTVSNGQITVTIKSHETPSRIELVEGWESRYYLQRTPLPVLEVEINHAGRISTIVEWIL